MTEKVPGTPVHEYQDALACLECIWHLVGSGADIPRLDPLLMSSFYERLSTVLVRLHASEQRPGLKESLRSLLEEAHHQQLKAERLCRRPAPPRRAGSGTARQGSTSPVAPDRARPPAAVPARPAAVSDDAVRVGDSASVTTFPFTRSELRFSDVAGLEQTKASLAEAVIMPVQFPHLFTGGRRPWTRILLYGPPGTGKSRLAAAVAGEAGATLFPVSAADLLSSYVGETEKAMSELFAAAARTPGRSVIFVDELDGLCRERSGREEEHTRRLKTHLLQLMDGLLAGPAQAAATFLLAATNCPWDLDPAFLRRFQRRLHVPLPDRAAQRRLVELHLAGTAAPLTERQWQQLLAGTAGLSGSDLAQLTQHALYQPLRELETARSWRRTADGKFMCATVRARSLHLFSLRYPLHAVAARDLRLSDFLDALRTTAPSVSAEMLRRYEEFGRGRAGPP